MPSVLRATAHPTRVAILDLLRRHATLTASECARQLDLSPKVCSFHLQSLARYGLIEEVPAPGRSRPWQLAPARPADAAPASPATATPPTDVSTGAPTHAPTNPLRMARDRALHARVRRDRALLAGAADAVAAAAASPEWTDAVTVYDHVATMAPPEVRAWAEEVERVTRRHARRAATAAETGNAAGTGDATRRYPVHLVFYGFPDHLG
jgi:DNA-binding transcriptional ArsR family regulator